ncbi:MAG TPA: PqqD family peptide modification chaperone [Ferrovibrio sp.]|uniref:PqqD family peptide modification chaperone n=1 Tax=Ferrovibrio sp. TaxID=1917215 RepID=UPI002ED17F35
MNIAAATPTRLRLLGIRPDISLHCLDEAGALFCAGTKQLFALNTTGTFIWCQLEEGACFDEILLELQRVFGFSPSEAAHGLETALQQWRSLGLLDETAGRSWQNAAHGGVCAGPYRLLDMPFRLRLSAPDMLEDLATLLEPLVGPGIAAETALEIEIGGDLSIRAAGQVLEQCSSRAQLVPAVKTALIRLALERSKDFCAIHAAGISLGGRCLLLPGRSGRGKSTLAAALVGTGLPLLGDDTIVLADHDAPAGQDDGALQARPLPFAICLKSGSWALLQPRFPQLALAPIHHRLDGKRVRYLLPPNRALWADPASRQPVGWIVFPDHVPDAEASLAPLPRPEALSRLMAECYPLADGFDAGRVAQLIGWIRRIDCFTLRFGAVEDGVELLRRLAA